MRCPACCFENASGIKFCGEYGAPLKLKCSGAASRTRRRLNSAANAESRCSRQRNRQRHRTRAPTRRNTSPRRSSHRAAALEGERKQVTVLFADVKGSMDLAEQVDPEEWHKIMDRFFAILSEGVHRFEGTVNQYTGDGIMALFGAPIAHEDHAQRACYAALHLRDELRPYADELRIARGLNFSVRMGLNSGEVVVGKIGEDLRMDYTAQGHTVGLGGAHGAARRAGQDLSDRAHREARRRATSRCAISARRASRA